MKRTYQLKQRAKAKEATRQTIVEAAIDLHQMKGVASTSFEEIADRAKVGKVTVYRHFPDELSLVSACSGAYFERNQLPDIDSWCEIDDANERLHHGLQQTYAYHQQTEPMLSKVLAEARELGIVERYDAHWRRGVEILSEPFSSSIESRHVLKAGLVLALAFETWHLLVRQRGLTQDQSIQLVSRLVSDKSR